jgi:hypothetical protein
VLADTKEGPSVSRILRSVERRRLPDDGRSVKHAGLDAVIEACIGTCVIVDDLEGRGEASDAAACLLGIAAARNIRGDMDRDLGFDA